LLESGSTEEQITDAISREFNANADTVSKDITNFLEELKAHKLVDSEPHRKA